MNRDQSVTRSAPLTNIRLRHYGRVTFGLARRRWQVVLLTLALLSPTLMPMFEQIGLLGAPVLALLVRGSHVQSSLIWLCTVAVALLWTTLQKEAVFGGSAWQYMCLHTANARLKIAVDLATLGVVDLPIFLPFGAAIITIALAPAWPQRGWALAVIVGLALQIPWLQLTAAKQKYSFALMFSIEIGGLAARQFGADLKWLSAILLLALLAGALPSARTVPARSGVQWGSSRHLFRLSERNPVWRNVALINIRLLSERAELRRRWPLGLLAAAPAGAWAMCRWESLRHEPTVAFLSLILVPLVFQVAGLQYDLTRAHEPTRDVLRVLGLRTATTQLVNLCVISAAFLLVAIPLICVLYAETFSPRALMCLPIGLVTVVALSLLNQVWQRQALVPKAVVAIAAAWLLIEVLVP